MYSSVVFGMMPEDIQNDQEKVDEEIMLEIGEKIDDIVPNTYTYKCYYVEN